MPTDNAMLPVTTAVTVAPATSRRQWRDDPRTISAPIRAARFAGGHGAQVVITRPAHSSGTISAVRIGLSIKERLWWVGAWAA